MEDYIKLALLLVVIFFLTKENNVVKKVVTKVKSKIERFIPAYGHLTGANDRLYLLLDTMRNIFMKYEIPYAITGDVLLSAVEKERLTVGQMKALILIPQDYVDKLLAASDELKAIGLGISDIYSQGYRISSSVSLPIVNDTSIEIYPVTLAGDKWITNAKSLGYGEWYGKDELFPGKTYKLGNIDIEGPVDALPYLQRNFWSYNIHAVDHRMKRLFQLSPKFYGTNQIPIITQLPLTRVDYTNGIRLDPRPHPSGKRTVILGNGRTALVPDMGSTRIYPRIGRWRRYLWT